MIIFSKNKYFYKIMFRSITFNGTDKKQIGAPIIRRTNEMISEFDLQYERNYKIVKVVSQRELEFQEYLKQQEALQFRLENLIKILREYFKENNYNEHSYYILFKFPNKQNHRRRRRKKKKRMRPKTAEIKRNKYLFYRVTKNNYYFNKFKPYLYPLTNKEKKSLERKLYTDFNLKEKEKSNYFNMSPAQLKRFVDVFGFIPIMFQKEDNEDKNAQKKKFKRNFSSFNYLKKKNERVYDKNLINIKKGLNNKIMKPENIFNFIKINNSNSYNNVLMKNFMDNNYLKSNNLKSIRNNNLGGDINKNFLKFNFMNNYKINLNGFKPNSIESNNSYNNLIYNNRYFPNMKLGNSKSINNYNYNSLKSLNSANISLFNNINNKSINNVFLSQRYKNKDSKIKIKKNVNIENLKKYSFTNQCIKAIQKSEIINKDINYLNKIYDLTGENFYTKKNKIENKSLKKINFISMLEIYEKDFKPDIKKQFEKKYEHLKEDYKGHIQVKKIEFIRKPKSKLKFVDIYNKRREQKMQNRVEFVYNNIDEEKSDLTSYQMKRSLSKIKLSKNMINKFRNINSSSSGVK